MLSKIAHSSPDLAALNVLSVHDLSITKNSIFIRSADNFSFSLFLKISLSLKT